MTSDAVRTGYAPVNGLSMHYEIHGTGKPLILIHGTFGMTGMFAQLVPGLAETRQVIAVELQGHAHTADIDRPFSFESMADDIAALIAHLGFAKADILGFSLGGGVALQTAIRHPAVVNKLVVISAPMRRNGWYPDVLAGVATFTPDGMAATPVYALYRSVAPNPHDWPNLVNKTRELAGKDYDWSEAVARLHAPALIVVGDHDILSPLHAAEMFGLLGGGTADSQNVRSQLAVLPGTDHITLIDRADLLLPILAGFLNAPVESTP